MKFKLFIVLLVFQLNFAQQRVCGMKQHMEKTLSNPEKKENYLKLQQKFKIEYEKILTQRASNRNGSSTSAVLRIPVAVHYPSAGLASVATKTCLRAFAQNQVNILNADYNATNSDISNWTAASVFYPGVQIGNLQVEFVLATQNHPASSGITNGNVAVTFGTDYLANSDTDATWTGYMNFVVRNLSGGLLGYSNLGGSPNIGDAVVMDNNAFASGAGCTGFVPSSPYNLGRTVTHELGHFFNLDHTFGDDTGCTSSNTDLIDDTPKVGFLSLGCPANGSVAGCDAGQKALTMNYMDYVDDACMYMFSKGQETVMLAYLNAIRSQFSQNILSVNDEEYLKFSIYPNPSSGTVNIKFVNDVSDFEVVVYDMSGREVGFVKNNAIDNKSIVLDNISKGIYFVSVSHNNKRTTKKIIIE
ncbi:zinc-dependent metalloprotease [Flavobacterium sp.]|uniref:zinc-dependent metalloprotease n=1 Tax=Flavobacterium sp. TaxID=239 RepID=UPI00286E2D66|nr:zinc-dependent metalloprotease [Flavobacterium sp.]